MAKPSIFSKEYEKRMKKRKRKILISFLIVFMLAFLTIVKVYYSSTSYTGIKQKIQAWIDSDTNELDSNKQNSVQESKVEEKVQEIPEEKFLEFSLIDGSVFKAIYTENNGEIKFTNAEFQNPLIKFDISPSGKKVLVLDTDQSISVYDINGNKNIVSKDEYISKKGDKFTKQATLKNQPQYLWNSNPKFVNEESIIFVSNRPYFGTASVKQYLWITNIINGADTVKWNLAGTNIEIVEREEKGIKITIDGNSYYVAQDGNITQ